MSLRDAAFLGAMLAVTCAAPLWSQDAEPSFGDRLTRSLEVQAHRALITRIARPDSRLAAFETDGCSGGLSRVWEMISDRLPEFAEVHETLPPWEGCCVTHDRAYHDAGGATTADASYDARLSADAALRACVAETGRARRDEMATLYDVTPERVVQVYGLIADAMHMAVRFGGGPCTGLPWRWGYGYPQCAPVPSAGGD